MFDVLLNGYQRHISLKPIRPLQILIHYGELWSLNILRNPSFEIIQINMSLNSFPGTISVMRTRRSWLEKKICNLETITAEPIFFWRGTARIFRLGWGHLLCRSFTGFFCLCHPYFLCNSLLCQCGLGFRRRSVWNSAHYFCAVARLRISFLEAFSTTPMWTVEQPNCWVPEACWLQFSNR